MRTFRRSVLVWVALLGIVFSQWAVAAHACPLLAPISHTPAVEQPGDDMAGEPCAESGADFGVELDAAELGVCMQHCGQGSQSVDTSPAAAVYPALVLAFVLPLLDLSEPAQDGDAQAPDLAHLTEPPPFLRTGRLRI